MSQTHNPVQRYKLRLRRKRLLWQAFRKRRALRALRRNTGSITPESVLLFASLRNESLRLPHFLEHYRKLGVSHFLFVDNESSDGSTDYLLAQPDVSLWQASASYKSARFGMDWLSALLWKYGSGHWCVTVDLDELLIYPDWQRDPLPALAQRLRSNGQCAMGALMLDLYPKGAIGDQVYDAGDDPLQTLKWFDGDGYWAQRQTKMDNLWLQGGARARVFFRDAPERAPTLNKIPFVFWQRPYVYVNSTHNALPSFLNRVYDTPGHAKLSGVLLHTKFLPDSPERARLERRRGEHFADAMPYQAYYETLSENPDLWCEASLRYKGWEQLRDLGLMSDVGS